MKIHFLLIVSILALLIAGCANDSLQSDEDYNEAHTGVVGDAPDAASHLPSHEQPLGNQNTPRY